MTTYQKSLALWIGGAVAGAALLPKSSKASGKPIPRWEAAMLGAIVVGGVGDGVLDRLNAGLSPLYPLVK